MADAISLSAAREKTNLRVGAEPPHNLDDEQALLASIIAQNNVFHLVFDLVSADDFYHPACAKIYTLLATLINDGKRADPITIKRYFAQDDDIKAIGGEEFLSYLAGTWVSHANAKDYANLIRDMATRRRLLTFGHDVQAIALDMEIPDPASDVLIARAETQLYKLAEKGTASAAIGMRDAFNNTLQRIEESFQRGGALPGVSSGIARLDEMLGGFQPGHLYTLAGRPSMGKTAIGLTLAANAAKSGAKTLFHSLEMEHTDIVARLIARVSGIPTNKQRGYIENEVMQKIQQSRDEIQSWDLHIDDSENLTFQQLRGRALRQKRRHGLDLIIIDYLGLVKSSDQKLNRNYQIEEITTGLKSLAKELKVPVILLAQLNRELEKRDDKRPMLSDLRDSGSIEQDSDVVMFIYRHEYYLVRSEPKRMDKETDERFNDRYERWQEAVAASRGRGELIVAKHRQGEIGVVPLKYFSWKCFFTDEDAPAETVEAF